MKTRLQKPLEAGKKYCLSIWVSLAGETARLLHHYCLSENVAAVLPAPWRKSVAMRPDEAAMLALLDHNA